MPKEQEDTTFINVILNRASLGKADNVFVRFPAASGSNKIGWVPRKNITILQQSVTPKGELTAKLEVCVVEKCEGHDIVAVETKPGTVITLKVDSAFHAITA